MKQELRVIRRKKKNQIPAKTLVTTSVTWVLETALHPRRVPGGVTLAYIGLWMSTILGTSENTTSQIPV